MRVRLFIAIALFLGFTAATAEADTQLEDFKTRIEAALAIGDQDGRITALGELFYRGALDDWSKSLAERTIKRLAKLQGREVSFAPRPPTTEPLHVANGYEYWPNLMVLGQVIFTDPTAAPGNNTKILYGRHPTERRYSFPLVVRRLVNADAPPDKQLQILTIGAAHPPVTFEGWCDIALSNNTTKRVKLDDQKIGNQTRIMRGQSIEACEVKNTSGRGSLSLRLFEDDRTIFERQIETPQTTITYRKP